MKIKLGTVYVDALRLRCALLRPVVGARRWSIDRLLADKKCPR